MMLEKTRNGATGTFAGKLEGYLGETLHAHGIKVKRFGRGASLPTFLERAYKFCESQIAGRRCIFLVAGEPAAPPSELAKHVGLIRSAFDDATIILAVPSLSAHNRSRLIALGIPFVVPGNQLYIPDLAMDLREHFRAPKSRSTDGLSPAAQAVLFHYLLRLDEFAMTPSAIAKRLRYSAMSIGRAFDDLVAVGLAKAERRGKERHLQFEKDRRALFEAASTLLRSPVRSMKYVRGRSIAHHLKLAGESALAELTDLTRPPKDTYAVAASNWKASAEAFGLVEVDEYEENCVIDTWSYDPAGLSNGPVVDPLSLYAQFRDHRDERVSISAEKLLENLPW